MRVVPVQAGHRPLAGPQAAQEPRAARGPQAELGLGEAEAPRPLAALVQARLEAAVRQASAGLRGPQAKRPRVRPGQAGRPWTSSQSRKFSIQAMG
jgi:hypothetical protein